MKQAAGRVEVCQTRIPVAKRKLLEPDIKLHLQLTLSQATAAGRKIALLTVKALFEMSLFDLPVQKTQVELGSNLDARNLWVSKHFFSSLAIQRIHQELKSQTENDTTTEIDHGCINAKGTFTHQKKMRSFAGNHGEHLSL